MHTLNCVVRGSEPLVLKSLMEEKKISLSKGQGILHVLQDEKDVEVTSKRFQACFPEHEIIIFPAYDCFPYDRVSPSQSILSARVEGIFKILEAQKHHKPFVIMTSAEGFLRKIPQWNFFENQQLTLSLGDELARGKLLGYLHDKGYTRTETVCEVGDYAVRGSLIDLYTPSHPHPLRIDFLGEHIESLRFFDILTQKTIEEILDITLRPVSELLLNSGTIENFRKSFRARFTDTASLYTAISEGRSFPGMEHYLPLFYEGMTSLLSLEAYLIFEEGAQKGIEDALSRIQMYYEERNAVAPGEKPYYPLRLEEVFLTPEEIEAYEMTYAFPSFLKEGEKAFSKPITLPPLISQNKEEAFVLYIKEHQDHHPVVLCAKREGARERLEKLLKEHDISVNPLKSLGESLPKGLYNFLYPIEESFNFKGAILLSDSLFFGGKQERRGSSSQKDNAERFFKELQTYNPGDFLVHTHHGIGQYLGLETLWVERIPHDCIILTYDGGDKLFLPVENMDMLTHFAKEGSVVELDKLGSAHFQARKAKVKKRLLEIAQYLMDVAAERQLKEGLTFPTTSEGYEAFCQRFPHIETDDQARAIEEVEDDFLSGKPMDRLICGDVGFGKTEVALRAAFLAMASGYQVAILVPTTLLARQHFELFQKRFQGFSYRIEMLCRLVKAKKATDVKKEVKEGRVHLVIATHAIFSKSLEFTNLGLLIVDEEQHFGVKQKETLKKSYPNLHVLTLTATPIPRTLQMSLSGIRDLSLITTPPVDRLPIRTFTMEEDWGILHDVMIREHQRGGQIFFVSPRLEDLPSLQEKIARSVPDLKIAIAHGQMPAAELENTIQDFYDRHFDILLCTNIIESGIDISNANTLIVYKSHLFGLAQLYQIRGRVGRGKKQGYAYLTVPSDSALSLAAQRRLKVLQSLDHLGAGFTLASHDLDIRGGGNLLGEEQSGHIREVGVELYQKMLGEAILSLRTRETKEEIKGDNAFSPTLNLGIPILIPEIYIGDLSLRLGLYKRIAMLKNEEDVQNFREEIVDRFGSPPKEVDNLLSTISLKQLCLKAGIEKIDVGSKGIVLSFYKNRFANPEGLLRYIQKNATLLKIRPDQKLVLSCDGSSKEKQLSLVFKLCRVLGDL